MVKYVMSFKIPKVKEKQLSILMDVDFLTNLCRVVNERNLAI
jgi:hypothetical protein